MAFWDFMKGSGKSVLGAEAEAASPAAQSDAELARAETDRKVAALKELFGLDPEFSPEDEHEATVTPIRPEERGR